jgi:hypothetical protein
MLGKRCATELHPSPGSICLGWLRTAILLIIASVARITGVSHQNPTRIQFLSCTSQHLYRAGVQGPLEVGKVLDSHQWLPY